MFKKNSSLLRWFIPSLCLSLPAFVSAAGTSTSALSKLQTVAGSGYNTTVTLPQIVGLVIRSALSLLGVIFIIVLIVAGFRWMTASGNEQKVEKAQNAVKRGAIGLVIVVSAWAFWNFIVQKLILGI